MSGKNIIENFKAPTYVLLLISIPLLFHACSTTNLVILKSPGDKSIIDMIEGGRLYDNWWKELERKKGPEIDNPLWKLQTTNKRKGSATWRCKECHGWDYKGRDGAYSTGSHKTGFPGILNNASLSLEDIESILRGSTNPDHDFSNVLDPGSISKLAAFIKKGLIDLEEYIDYQNKKPFKVNARNGLFLYETTKCAHCHGEKGTLTLEDKNETLGIIANKNPWEFVHKTRFGQPGKIMPAFKIKLNITDERERMPSGVEGGYSAQDLVDLLGYSRSLPAK